MRIWLQYTEYEMFWIAHSSNRRASTVLIKIFILAALLSGNVGFLCSAQRPNVVLILTDDQGYSDVGFNGNPLVKTPVLDELASGATVFNNFFAHPVCSPTRASLMTGRYAFRTGVIDTQEGMSILRPAEITVAEALKTSGYKTGLFGKWHLGDNAPARPMDQGFDRTLTHVGGMIGAPYNPLDGNAYFDPILIDDGVEKHFRGYCTDIFTDAAIDFIHSSDGEPFFVYLSTNTPHHPLTVKDLDAKPYRDAGLSEETSRYYGMISNIDDNVGRLLEALKAAGVVENTLIIFLGDNGTSSLHKQADLWESGLRGRKTYVYENGIRVPMLIKLPGVPEKGSRLEALASVEDLMPTILEVCKVNTSADFDGQSLLPLLTDSSAMLPDRSFYFQFHRGTRPDQYRNMAVRRGAYKLIQPVGRGMEPFAPGKTKFELYDLSLDPFEREDIARENPEIVKGLKADYDHWFVSVCAEGFEPVRTWIGSDIQNPVTLTRQDWRGGGLFDGDLGVYNLDIKTTGSYRITCRWSTLLKNTHPVTLKLNDRVIEKEILYAESEVRFDELELPEGECQLEAWVEIDGEKCGFRFIEIEKLESEKENKVVSGLKATVSSGQVFLTWNEAPVPEGVTFNVYMDSRPITASTFSKATLVGHHIEAGSACDWWQDPASFDPDAETDRSHGFLIDGKELGPQNGLFVHTASDKEPVYFAVLPSSADPSAIKSGVNSLEEPVLADPMLPQPIRLKEGPEKGSAPGKSLTLELHGRGGGWDKNNRANFLVFGDALQGWREGLARKFVVESSPEGIVIKPLDRLFSWDKRDHVPAINTWWYGCNNGIYDPEKVNDGVVVNYTEEHLLYLVRWAQEYFGTDPDHTYIRGKSMGGSGAISTAFHHPEVFATVYSYVPIVSYTKRAGKDGISNLKRLDGLCGRTCDETIMSSEGIPVMERMNSERIVLESREELPFLVLCNGRTDGSIPWVNNPSFYRALNKAKRGFACYWNNGKHNMSLDVPEDMNDFYSLQPGMPHGTSYPAFSNFSDNYNPGNGEKDKGDITGWMNRGLYWTDIAETQNSWSIRIFANGSFLPSELEVDVTPRRLTRFQIAPDETLLVNGTRMKADKNGLLTIRKVRLEPEEIVSLQIKRML